MKRRPDGVGTTSRGAGPGPGGTTASSASPHGSGRITMPAPPPYGVSSTVRCRSWVQVRRSCTPSSTRPVSIGLADQREPQRREVVGEDRDDVGPEQRPSRERVRARRARRVGEQPGHVGDHEAAAGEVDLGHERLDERHQPRPGGRC